MQNLTRDFVGYGGEPPHPRWPGGARLAVNFVVNFEEGSEESLANGDARTEFAHTETRASPVPAGRRDLAAESMFEYGARAGFWRLHRLFLERGLPYTVFACALAIERNPPAAKAIRDAGLDVCCHGWRWIEHYKLDEEQEREHIRRAIASLKATLGAAPDGWYCRYGPSENTRRLTVEQGGFLYDSDSYADDLPFWVKVGDVDRLVVPYSLAHNDGQFMRGAVATGGQFFEFLKDGFDVLYAEGAESPKLMNVGLHMRIVGQPARAAGVARFLDYVKSFPDVWVAPRNAIARHWAETHPPPAV